MNSCIPIAGVVIKELYRRKDFYVLFVLTVVITLLFGSVNFFNDSHIARYLKDLCFLLIWICSVIIAVTTTARQIPAERESRTIFPLLAKPVGRGELIAGKFLGCWFASGIALIVFYFFFGIISASREHTLPWVLYLQTIWLHWVFLAIIIAMVLLGSIVFAAPSSNATICLIVVVGIIFAGGHLNRIATGMPGISGTIVYAIYYLIPHLEWYYNVRDFVVHDWPAIEFIYWAGATVYGLLYAGFFMCVAWLVFQKKTLTL
jgi:ABC-type transport system involved in multi-copper enzyme maturation permease subunit